MASSSLLLCVILSSFYLAASSGNGGFTVDLIHRDSPQLVSGDAASVTRFSRMRSAFDRSFSRKSSLLSSLSSSLKEDSVEAPLIHAAAGGEYVMKLKIGTPPVEILSIADTGSDLTWTQCQPCVRCDKQNLPLFDPSRSSSYRSILCQSELCRAAPTASCDASNRCQYNVTYGDQTYSIGDVAAETLTFDGGASFPKVAFGCGHGQNSGTFSGSGSGIVGLGRGAISIINQLQSTIGGKFSYCLTLFNSNATSKISFGTAATVGGDRAVSTPLVKKYQSNHYYLTLEGFSVGDERIDFSSTAVESEGNIIIDSGTTLTYVQQELYERVEAAIVKAVTAERVSDPRGTMGLCYRVGGGGKLEARAVTAHFKGGDVTLPPESVFVELDGGISCLTVVPTKGNFGIFGNLHQMNYRVGYDLVKGEVSFLKTDCSIQG